MTGSRSTTWSPTTRKHNEANGEDNRDGADDNRSWNCGIEGPTDDPAVEALRNRQVKNFLTVTMLSLGVPMILMGDEVRRTQGGNNNAYCHDDESNWFDWSLLEKHADVHRFVTLLAARRLLRDVEHEQQRVSLTQLIADANKAWHGVKLDQPDWGEHSHSIAFTAGTAERADARPPDPERLLGAARIRAAAGRRPVAALDRHVPARSAGHRRMAEGLRVSRQHLPGRTEVRGRSLCRWRLISDPVALAHT